MALTVLACLRSGTRADVAWLVEAEGLAVADWSGAVVFTPGGGRIGGMAGGAVDVQLAGQAGRRDAGRIASAFLAITFWARIRSRSGPRARLPR